MTFKTWVLAMTFLRLIRLRCFICHWVFLLTRLLMSCLTSHSRIFHWRAVNFGLCSALRAFEHGGSLSYHTCCDTGLCFFFGLIRRTVSISRLLTFLTLWPYLHKTTVNDSLSRTRCFAQGNKSLILAWLIFLANLSSKCKWDFLNAFCLSVCKTCTFLLILQNHRAIFNQSWHKSSLGYK
jgi:hypothetical protein